jgi:hypothetical protein
MADNQKNKERLKEITDSIEQGIQDLFQSEKYAEYLRTMSRFHRYSVNNVMLINMQRPNATLVAGFNKWRDQFGRNVMKGEKGIKIIAPTPFKKKIEQDKLDPDTKTPMRDRDGNILTEEVEIQIPMYKVVSVFDVSQTDGKALPELASSLSGNVQEYEVFMEALRRSAPVPIAFEKMAANLDGYFNSDEQRIAIRDDMSEVQTVSATIHEIAHSKLHNKDLPEIKEQWKLVMVSDGGTRKDYVGGFNSQEEAEAAGEDNGWVFVDENQFAWRLEVEEDTAIAEFVKKSRRTEEVEAESVSYAVCAYYGIATGENSFGYIASWSKDKDLTELRASLETINKTASGLISDIDNNYREIAKERGIDLTAPEQSEQPAQEDAPEQSVPDTTPEQAPSEPEYVYKLHANPRSTSEKDASFIQAYERKDGELYPGDIIGFGAYDALRPLLNKLNDKKSAPEEARKALDAALDKQPGYEEWSEPATAENSPDQPDTPSDDVSAYLPDEAPLGGGRIVDMQVETYNPEAKPEYPANYPMPDPTISIEAMNAYGYTDGDMLPLTKERAIELFQRDVPVYMLYEDNTEAMAFNTDEIITFDGMLGVTAADWELAPADLKTQPDMEQAFFDNPADCFAIYQVKSGEEYRDLRFERYDQLEKQGIVPDRANYDCVYTAPLTAPGGTIDRLYALFDDFNDSIPADYHARSASVSDIIALKQSGKVSCHYIDAWGYKELSAFLKPENYLKTAEMTAEDDYGMIDGIINNGSKPTVAELEATVKAGGKISLLDLADAVRDERGKQKPSVLQQLKTQPPKREQTKTAPVKGAEMEL